MSVATMETGRVTWGSPRDGQVRRIPARPTPRTRRAASAWTAPIAWALVLAGFIAVVGAVPTARDFVPRPAAAAITVKVASKDTLWSIAESHRLPGATTAETVEAIKQANNLTHTTLHAGDTLSIPAADVPGTAFAQVSDSSVSD